MSLPPSSRPPASEYAPYYGQYIARVPDGDILATLESQGRETARLLGGLDEAAGNHRYALGKWSLKEVVGHLNDTERVFTLRALAFSRNERAHLFGMEQDEWVAAAGFDRQPLAALAAESVAIREATMRLFRSFDGEHWTRSGTASGVGFTVRAIPWIIAGHERHHLGVLRDRYL